MTSATPAPLGHYVSTAGATSATQASPGTYVDMLGRTSATPAPLGYYVSTAAPPLLPHLFDRSQASPSPGGCHFGDPSFARELRRYARQDIRHAGTAGRYVRQRGPLRQRRPRPEPTSICSAGLPPLRHRLATTFRRQEPLRQRQPRPGPMSIRPAGLPPPLRFPEPMFQLTEPLPRPLIRQELGQAPPLLQFARHHPA